MTVLRRLDALRALERDRDRRSPLEDRLDREPSADQRGDEGHGPDQRSASGQEPVSPSTVLARIEVAVPEAGMIPTAPRSGSGGAPTS